MFGDEVRAHRLRRGLTQEQLVELSGVGLRTLRSIETGKVARPRPSTVRLLVDAFGLDGAERDRFFRSALQRSVDKADLPDGPNRDSGPDDTHTTEHRHANWLTPRQLPPPPQLFTGRTTELADLEGVPDASTVVISAIDGMAGVGKTGLAVRVAHKIADRYPDGQLFIDLHGYTKGIEPIDPTEALDDLLRALGIPGTQIPAGLDQRAALYRTRLANQRTLIVLDNAATEAQVTPLLPGSPGCLVLVTSRRRLAGLDHTRALSLDTLPTADAVTLLAQATGEDRLAGQPPELLAELVELCGRLPLAIRIAAARLRCHHSWSPKHLVRRLRDQQRRLAELEAGQRSIAAALDLSYHHLGPDQQRTYRLLGLHPGPDIDAYATAALLDSTLLEAGRMLEQLLDAHLLLESVAGRYRFHDLTRAHAAHTAAAERPEPTGNPAMDRLLSYYRHTTSLAMDAAYPYERQHRPHVPPLGTAAPDLSDSTAALDWLDTESPNLLATAKYATERGGSEHALQLSALLHRHLRTRGRGRDAIALHRQALSTARVTGNRTGELEALVGLGHIYRMQGRYERATDHHGQALRIARTTGNRTGELEALVGLGHIHRMQGRYEQATDHYQQVLPLARATGHRTGELDTLAGLGNIHWIQGRYEQATDHYQQALQLARATGNHAGELDALNGLGHLHRRQGQYQQATDHYQQVLQLARATRARIGELNALNGLGAVHRRQGQYQQATDHYRQVLQLARATGARIGELSALNGLGAVHRRQGQYQQATDHYQQLLTLALDARDRNYEFEARHGIGLVSYAAGHPDEAITHHNHALTLARELGQPDDQARAHDGLAHAWHTLRQPERASEHWQQALNILTSVGLDHTEDEETTITAIRNHLADLRSAVARPPPG